jgi:Zn-dependent protease with chaperone function
MVHVALLVALVAGAVAGVVMVVGFVAMLVTSALWYVPPSDLTMSQLAAGVLMVLLWGGGIVAGLGALARQCRGCVALARWVATVGSAPSPRLAAAARELATPGPTRSASTDHGAVGVVDVVVEVVDEMPYAFTYGIWRPRIVVSSGLVAATTRDELLAVLHHEDSHRQHRDPLKVLALRTWATTFFLVPVVGALLRRVRDRQELRADRAALRACGVSSVAAALLKAVGEPVTAPGTALAAMGGPALLDARVTQLETGRPSSLLAAIQTRGVLSSVPGVALIVGYGVLMFQVCMAVQVCCMH